jgi:hypothetical protein
MFRQKSGMVDQLGECGHSEVREMAGQEATVAGSPPKPHLVYTIAFDPPGKVGTRVMAKMLAASLMRTHFAGDIVIFRNSPTPMFLVERKGLEEVFAQHLHGLDLAVRLGHRTHP